MRDLLHTCAVKLCVIWKNWPKMCGNHEKLSGNPASTPPRNQVEARRFFPVFPRYLGFFQLFSFFCFFSLKDKIVKFSVSSDLLFVIKEMADRLQKEELLYERSEAVFIEWAKENSIQIQSMSPIEDNAQNRYDIYI